MAIVTFRAAMAMQTLLYSEPVDIDMELFRAASPPFEGSSEEEFFDYINENAENLSDDDSLPEELRNSMFTLYDGENVEEFWREHQKWLEAGEVDEQYSRTGNFNIKFTSE